MNIVSNLAVGLLFAAICVVGVTNTQEVEVKPLTYKEGIALHKENGKPLVIQYSASWCPPCRQQTRLMKEMLKNRDDFIWSYVDVDKEGPFPQIKGIPYIAIQVKGKWVHSRSGYMTEEALLETMGLTGNILDFVDTVSYPRNIDKLIEEGKETGIFEFPSGTFNDFPMVELGTATGFDISGHGKSSVNIPSGKSTTRLIGGGFHGVISHFTFEKICFVDQTIHIDSGPSIGSGNGVFQNCSFINCTILFGNSQWNGNGADTTFRDCVFIRSHVQNTSSQNLNYQFSDCQINTCGPAFFICNGGGKIHFDHVYVLDTPVLVNVTGPGHVFGSQNGSIILEDIDYDQKHTQPGSDVLVDDTNNWYGKGRRLFLERINFSPTRRGITLRKTLKTEWTVYGEDTVFNQLLIN